MKDFFFFANYGDYERPLASIMLSLAMLGMGAKLSIADFKQIFKVPLGFTVGMIVQVLLIPVLAWGFLLLMAEPEYHEAIREALGRPKELPVSFDPRGARVIFIGNRS